MKKILIIGIPILLIVIGIVYFFIFRNKTTTNQSGANTTTSSPVSLPASTPSTNSKAESPAKLPSGGEGKIIYNTSSGDIAINDFVKNSETADNGVIYPVDKTNYNIGYNSTDKEFIITLLVNSDIEISRKQAENDLLTTLGVSKEDACKLKVYVYVSAAKTKDNSLTQNHGLSFCPGSTAFPN